MKVFVLPAVQINLFPSTIRPISLQSTQHQLFLQQAISENVPVAIAFYMQGESHYRPIAGFGQATLGEPFLNKTSGEMTSLLYIQGEGKVNLSESVIINSGIVTYIEAPLMIENFELSDSSKDAYSLLSKTFAHWIDKYIVDPLQKKFFLKSLSGVKEVIAACSAYLVKDFEMQYELMEITDINEQIIYLYRLMLSQQLIF